MRYPVHARRLEVIPAPVVAPLPDVVTLLEHVLEAARSGSVRGVAVVVVEREPNVIATGTAYATGDAGIAVLHYGAACLVDRLLKERA